jgi:hypothetical protein
MPRTKLIVTGESPIKKIESIISQCTNKNQIVQHIKRYDDILYFLRSRTSSKSDKSPMELLYLYQENMEVPLCICGKERIYHCQGYRPTCGVKKCINKIRELSKIEFCRKNYGVDFVTQLDTMKEKSKETLIEKYGVDNITKSKETIKKRKQSNLKKWGVEDPIMLSKFRKSDIMRIYHDNKIQNGLPKNYKYLGHIENTMMVEYYSIECPNNHITTISKSNLSVRKSKNQEICNLCNEYIGSMVEQEVFDYIKTIYPGNIIRSDRKLIKPLEIDMILEDIKICIEFNGVQHYEPIEFFGGVKTFEKRILIDTIKRRYCDDNKVPLLIIKYDDDVEPTIKNLFKFFILFLEY